jgi:glucose/arabinose dehydrogenase
MFWTRARFIAPALLALTLGSAALAQQVGPLPDIQKGTIAIDLTAIATGLGAPDYAISPPGDTHRLFVIEQKGTLLVVQDGVLLPTPALDISARVAPPLNPASANDERGFLGLAFHPGFFDPASPGYQTLYTYNSEVLGTGSTFPTPNANDATPAVQNYKNVVNEWKMSAADPNVVDPASRREVVSFGKNASNHNGGTITFGPDGYAYLALGDGGNANDVGPSHHEPGGNAQWLQTPLGKFLRFDPIHPSHTPLSTDPISGNGQYRIPASNPFWGPTDVHEIYAFGMRNPYRFAFDFVTGDLIHSDVGQNNVEEIDRITIGSNYGWAVKEGTFLFDRATGNILANSPGAPAGLTDPISGPLGSMEYDHSDGISITGGFVYRGSAIPELYGKYVFGDLAIRNAPPRVDGRLFYGDLSSGQMLEFLLPQFIDGKLPNQVTVHGFGQDGDGELYALVTNTPSNGTGGVIYKLGPQVPTPTLIELFRALPTPEGIRIEWQLANDGSFRSLGLERSGSSTGPWEGVQAAPVTEGRVTRVLDAEPAAGQRVWYRLSGVAFDGTAFSQGPIEVTALGGLTAFALSPLSPNPSDGSSLVSFTVPTSTRVRLTVTDVQGREVSVLSDQLREAGVYTAALQTGDLNAGVYFVRLQARGVALTRRLAVIR